jgi:LuxR family maltose regulon positive regulatory protein
LEFLREKQGNLAPEEIREVYTRDAQWCMENNLSIDAAVDYERARDYGGLLRVIYALPPLLSNTMASFFLETLNRLIPEIGDDEENEDRLFLWFIIRPRLLMFLGRFEEAAGEFRKAISRFESQPPGPRCSGLLALAYCSMGTLTILSCRYTRDYNFVSWFERGYHYYLEHPEAVPGQRIYSNLTSYVFQVGAPAEPGEIERSIKALTLAVPYASSALNGFLYGTDSLASAELAYYRGDLINAEKFARQAVYQGREKKQYEVENRGLFYLIRICIHTGNFTEIRELERQLEVQLEISDYYNRYVIYDIIMGRFYARIGLIDKVASWLRDTVDAGELNGLFGDFDVLIKAQCFFIEKKYLSALHILEEEKKRNNLGSFLLGKLEMAVLEAAARYHLGEEEQALAVLEEAYTMAAPNALDMPFIERGEDMRLLAGAILAREGSPARCGRIPRPWLENIRSRSSAYSKQVSLVLEQYREEKQAEQKAAVYLTRREREVLTGLARGLKRENIARETGLSLNAIKVIIRDIYRKLGAVNRADAIRIAGSLKIV